MMDIKRTDAFNKLREVAGTSYIKTLTIPKRVKFMEKKIEDIEDRIEDIGNLKIFERRG